MEQITSRSNPLIAHIRKLSVSRRYRRETGELLCEGPKLLEEALRWGAVPTVALMEEPVPLPDAVRQVLVPGDLLRSIAPTETPQKLLFLCRIPEQKFPERLRSGRYLVLDGLQDPGNVGTIWRTADAFQADGLFLLNHCADPYNPKTIRATMGACFRLPVWETELPLLRARLRESDIPLYATALRADTADLRTVSLQRAAVVIGSEGKGVSESVLDACEKTLKIPMGERCESLNAAVAAGVVLWEMYRCEK